MGAFMKKDKITEKIMLNTIAKALNEAISIINDLVDNEPCSYDHHGHCQAHGWPHFDPPCPHARAKKFIKKYSSRKSDGVSSSEPQTQESNCFMDRIFDIAKLTIPKRSEFAVGLERFVRWWRRLIGRNKIYIGYDVANGTYTTCVVEYDSKTGIYTVLDVKQKAIT